MNRASTTAEIVAAAQARTLLGQAAQHQLLADARHRVQVFDRTAGRLLVGTGATVSEAIANMSKEDSE